jgi:hypothetical protein
LKKYCLPDLALLELTPFFGTIFLAVKINARGQKTKKSLVKQGSGSAAAADIFEPVLNHS